MLSIVVPAVSEGYQVLLLSLQVQSNIVPLFVSMSKEKMKESQKVQSQYSKFFIYIFFFNLKPRGRFLLCPVGNTLLYSWLRLAPWGPWRHSKLQRVYAIQDGQTEKFFKTLSWKTWPLSSTLTASLALRANPKLEPEQGKRLGHKELLHAFLYF